MEDGLSRGGSSQYDSADSVGCSGERATTVPGLITVDFS